MKYKVSFSGFAYAMNDSINVACEATHPRRFRPWW